MQRTPRWIRIDRPRVVRVLERIAADLDNLGLAPNDPQADKESNQNDPQARHRHEWRASKDRGWVPIIQNIIRSLHRHRGAHLLLQTRSPVCLSPDFLTLSIGQGEGPAQRSEVGRVRKTLVRYRQVIGDFITHVGARAGEAQLASGSVLKVQQKGRSW